MTTSFDKKPSSVSFRAADLLATGKPFFEFPRYSILDLTSTTNVSQTGCGNNSGVNTTTITTLNHTFSEWLSQKLQTGHPFVIRDFEKLPGWDTELFSVEGLIGHSTKKSKACFFRPLVHACLFSHKYTLTTLIRKSPSFVFIFLTQP